jgi:hypothetical protein
MLDESYLNLDHCLRAQSVVSYSLRDCPTPPIMSSHKNFSFTGRLAEAIAIESTLDGNPDDTEGYPFEAVAGDSQPTPAGSLLLSCPSSPMLGPTSARKSAHPLRPQESARIFNKKAKSKALEKRKRDQHRRDAVYSKNATVQKRTVEQHIHPSRALQTDLHMRKLRATKPGYIGLRDSSKGSDKHIYSLDQMVGDGSEFGFELRAWDGR